LAIIDSHIQQHTLPLTQAAIEQIVTIPLLLSTEKQQHGKFTFGQVLPLLFSKSRLNDGQFVETTTKQLDQFMETMTTTKKLGIAPDSIIDLLEGLTFWLYRSRVLRTSVCHMPMLLSWQKSFLENQDRAGGDGLYFEGQT